jgi:S1-C subfamily serine protease
MRNEAQSPLVRPTVVLACLGAAAALLAATAAVAQEAPEEPAARADRERPADEEEAADADSPEGETAEGEVPEGEGPPEEASEGEVPEGEVPEGEVPEGEVPEGEVPEGEELEAAEAEPGRAEPGRAERAAGDEAAAPGEAGAAEAGAPVPAAVAAAEEPGPTCAGQARARAAGSVVRIRSGDQWGAGFVYHSPRHVVTAFSLMARGRPVTVVTRDGTRLEAQLLAKDESYDLAVLELREPVPGAEPLGPAPETSVRVGAPVVALGHPFGQLGQFLGERAEGLLRWSVSTGTIGAFNDAGVQADVALTAGHAGAPLLDCEGRVIGMIAGVGLLSADLGLAARIGLADDLIAAAGQPGDFLGDLSLRFGLGAGLIIDEDGETAGGFYLTLGATLFDRVSWMNRVGLFFGGLDDPLGDVISQDRDLVRISSLLGWRFFIDIAGFTTLYIVPAGGISITREEIETERVAVVPTGDPACTPSGTETCAMADIVRTSTSEWNVRPAVGLTFLLGGNLEIGYTLELDVDPVETFHVIRLGVQM